MTISVERRAGAPQGMELVELQEDLRWVSRGGETVVCSHGEWHTFGVRQDGVVLDRSVTSISGFPDGHGGLVERERNVKTVPSGEQFDLEDEHLTLRTW